MSEHIFIELPEKDHDILFQLFEVANDRDPIIDWRSPSDEEIETYGDDEYGLEAYPVTGNKEDYADHPLLPLAQVIQWYTPADCFTPDPSTLAIRTDVNEAVFLAELDKLGISYRRSYATAA